MVREDTRDGRNGRTFRHRGTAKTGRKAARFPALAWWRRGWESENAKQPSASCRSPQQCLSGSVHFHNSLPVNVHVHDGDKGAGHVHDPRPSRCDSRFSACRTCRIGCDGCDRCDRCRVHSQQVSLLRICTRWLFGLQPPFSQAGLRVAWNATDATVVACRVTRMHHGRHPVTCNGPVTCNARGDFDRSRKAPNSLRCVVMKIQIVWSC